ncbi:MAG TPA: TetR family transcriptional regulator [Acidimicrobiales bacterium]|jgi:AcrR family transcriptional regulator|nr:TetR family transcriptional regulator [Acidimicrobiales bacterium]
MAEHQEPELTAGQGLRSRKQARTRRELEAAALALFAANGYEETTVEEIAAAVEVSPRTFFRYFGSKEDVLFGYEERHLAALRRMIRDCPTAATDLSALEEVLLTFANYLAEEHQPLLIRATLVTENQRLRERSLRMLRSWELTLADELALQAGMDTPDLGLLVLAASSMGAINVAVRVWQGSGGQGSLMRVTKRALELAMTPEIPAPRRPRGRRPARRNSRQAPRDDH